MIIPARIGNEGCTRSSTRPGPKPHPRRIGKPVLVRAWFIVARRRQRDVGRIGWTKYETTFFFQSKILSVDFLSLGVSMMLLERLFLVCSRSDYRAFPNLEQIWLDPKLNIWLVSI